ncbi:flagellar type III secretion system pore protein FliP [Blastopirellula marina]|uniref:Flagellar biosynthetic protein fliP-putative transporter of flagellar proteins n=1 Tax=Blastopirellula marina DSM 3645 TaxID=314230 RepID=A3ZNY9_9BACT|nr:flagellar type III secretion system pore protein FliP [Blastopirellula marina]EAQ82037.1 flagellar biosynthetic protein fliP-putative transporter of flagellar proteins [Blastopirellula marina DSM 3645]
MIRSRKLKWICWSLLWLAISTSPVWAQMSATQVSTLGEPTLDISAESSLDAPVSEEASDLADFVKGGPEQWTSPGGLVSTIQIMVLLTVLSLAPAILLMTTGFIRIIIVLGLLRQALGTQQLPPSQVVTAIALFMTILLMYPTWQEVYEESVGPYTREEVNPDTGQQYKLFAVEDPATGEMGPDEAWEKGTKPIRHFMSKQIDIAGNSDDVWMFFEFLPQGTKDKIGEPQSYDDVPLQALIPAFILSELKTAFLIGFQIYLPFLILDIVVASITISMGMMMLPPVMISLPFKLLLFVLVDGWTLVVGMLLQSFATTI